METCTIEKLPVTFASHVADVKDLHDLAAKLQEHGIQFTDHEHLACPSCQNVHSFEKYVEAWNNPTEFFDIEEICWCGGELWWDRVPKSSRYALVCERCEWENPKDIISGHEG